MQKSEVKLRAWLKFILAVHEAAPRLHPQGALVFIIVAEAEEIDQTVLARKLNCSRVALSRLLGMVGSNGKGSLGLVDSRSDGDDRRRKTIFLTPKGRYLIERMTELAKDLT
ncbi:MAG: MarR family winged helix-turn-helix transcriptional regulator [Micropepsaceae bacterium]